MASNHAGGVEDITVETGVMGQQIVSALPEPGETGPYSPERRLMLHVEPGDAVKTRVGELPARRTDQAVGSRGQPVVDDQGNANGTGAVGESVGGLKVDGDELH
jgi:hypothetical protein